MEQQLAAVSRLLAEHTFASLEEANAYLQTALATGDLPHAVPTTPLEEAQEVIYQALETTGERRLVLALKALTISADCADAYVLQAEVATDLGTARRLYEQGMAAGERALGPQTFRTHVGHFWGLTETRPYMRARQGLAVVLWRLGERRAAAAHLQDMVRLNPNDNQGLRYDLASWLIVLGDDPALEQLFAAYPDEASAQWAYTRALHVYRQHGATPAATKALRAALRMNPHVPVFLLGVKPFPTNTPGYDRLGDEHEAVVYLREAVDAWLETPGAVEWLADVVRRSPSTAAVDPAWRPRRSPGK